MTIDASPAPRMTFEVVCIGPDGVEKWRDVAANIVTTAGKTDILDKYLKAAGYTAAWFLGLKGVGTAVVADTLASHASWTEASGYTGNRPAVTWGTTTTGSNTATALVFAITGTATIAGAFACTVATGTSGTLYNAADFASARSVASGDTLNVTPTLTIS